ncbi:TonB-dependent receptor [uncultured Algimonas sp.]|uniref:TonB-dependent receptor plug domain-containing protein n=1 Tax=uncultured Algimonas sp. TaxID=1547920 RepID=UPI00261CF202|nr:TonB-dependent receptor [uncultured Algimonas sp.]
MTHHVRSMLAFCFAIAFHAPTAFAQRELDARKSSVVGQPVDASTSDADSYPRAFFDRFFPQTALELLQRVPGFSIEGGESLRGFAGGAGNVLIDGERPTIKAGGIEDFLSRIPANAVERIVISRGAQRAGETAGQGLVANVVRKSDVVAGTWSAELERNSDGLVYPRGELSITAPLGRWRTTTKLNAFWEKFPFTRFERQTFGAEGALDLFEVESAPSSLGEAFVASEAERLFGGGTLTLNSRFGYSEFGRNTQRTGFAGRTADENGPDRLTDIDFDSAFWDGELSADWTRSVGGNSVLKLLALGSARDSEQSAVTLNERPVGRTESISRFETRRRPLEILSRATFGRVNGEFRPEFGVEVAYNQLDSRIALEVEDADGGIRAIDLPASDVQVREYRGEAFANIVWQAAPQWTAEGGLAVELSQITVDGDAGNSNDFVFLKPSLALIYQPSASLQFRAALRRSVGQLDFNDFAASANAEDDRLLAGNPGLGPDQTWRASISADFRTEGGIALNVEPFHEWREDVLEQVVLPNGVPGLANAGNARVWGLDANGALPLSGLVPGGLLEVTASFLDASFVDPITGRTRKITRISNPDIEIDFRQDIPSRKISWGVTYESEVTTDIFFANEVLRDVTGNQWSAFVETTRFAGVKMRINVRNIGGLGLPRDRTLFSPDRSGALTGSEFLDRRRGEFITLTVSDQF